MRQQRLLHVRPRDRGADIWETPQHLFDALDAEFAFTIDVAASTGSAKCARYYTPDDDGLAQSWRGKRVWLNPPYSEIEPWVQKAATGGAEIVVALLPNSTDTNWFHRWVLGRAEIRWLRGRLKFGGEAGRPPFGSMVCVWRDGPNGND